MATIYTRTCKDGTVAYRVQIRRKGLPKVSATFSCRTSAEEFIKRNERKYILDGKITFDRLENRRNNEFMRRKDV